MKLINNDFDERQVLDRGIAYRNGFITAIFLTFVSWIADLVFEDDFTNNLDYSTIAASVIFISATVFIISAMRKNAFEGLSRSGQEKNLMVLWLICGIIMEVAALITLFTNISTRALVVSSGKSYPINEILNPFISSVVPGTCMIIAGIVWIIKIKREKSEEEKLYEE